MSNPRKPKAQKIIEGTFDKSRDYPTLDVETVSKVPVPPAYMSVGAKTYWRKIAKILFNRGILSDADLMGLEILCNAYDMYRECRAAVFKQKGGIKTYLETNNSQTALALTTLHKLSMTIKTWCVSFGLSPTDRQKLSPIEEKPGEDPMKKFFNS